MEVMGMLCLPVAAEEGEMGGGWHFGKIVLDTVVWRLKGER